MTFLIMQKYKYIYFYFVKLFILKALEILSAQEATKTASLTETCQDLLEWIGLTIKSVLTVEESTEALQKGIFPPDVHR